MTRLFNKAFLYAFLAAPAFAGWTGFPLGSNTNAPTWYAIQQSGINPVGQVFAAIDERYRAVWGHQYGSLHTNAYGTVSSNYYDRFRPIITNTVKIDAGWITTNTWVGGGWYDIWDGPDGGGLYEVYYDASYVWTNVLDRRPDPDWPGTGYEEGLLGAIAFTNTYPVYTNVVVTNTFGSFVHGGVTSGVPVTRQTLATLWDYIGEIAPQFCYLQGDTNVSDYLAMDYAGYERRTMGDSYTNTYYTKYPKAEFLRLGDVFSGQRPGFGWETWTYQADPLRWLISSHWVEGGFKQPSTATLMAESRMDGAWVSVSGGYAPSYIPEWFIFGDTNAPLVYWAYSGTSTPPASVTVSGMVWSAGYITGTMTNPPDTMTAGLISSGTAIWPPVPTNALYAGLSAAGPVVEVIGSGSHSTNIWQSLVITGIDGGTPEPQDVVSVKWDLHHLAPYRLYAEEFDRMREALDAMICTVDLAPSYETDVYVYEKGTNGVWSLDSTNTVALKDSGSPYSGDIGTNYGQYRTIEVSVTDNNPVLPTNVTYTGTAASGFYWPSITAGLWWYDWPSGSWNIRSDYDFGYTRNLVALDSRGGLDGSASYTFTAEPPAAPPPVGGDQFLSDTWWYFKEWIFEYR